MLGQQCPVWLVTALWRASPDCGIVERTSSNLTRLAQPQSRAGPRRIIVCGVFCM